MRQFLDDLTAPALSVLVVQYVIAHLPIVEQHLRIGCTDEPRTCACSISDPMALTKASKLLFSILVSLLLIVVCIESHKGKPNYRLSMKLVDFFTVG